MTTHNFKIGDSVIFSGAENLLVWDENTQNLINVYFGMSDGVGIILNVKEDPCFGGEAEIYCDGQLLIMPWNQGSKPELRIINEAKRC